MKPLLLHTNIMTNSAGSNVMENVIGFESDKTIAICKDQYI